MQTDFHLRRSRCNAWTCCRALENRAAAAARLGEPARAALQADLLRLDAHHLLPAPSAALVAPVPQQRGAAGHDSSGGHVNSDDRTAGFDVEHLAARTQLPSSQQQGHGRQQEHQLCSASKSRDCSQAGSPANSRPSTPPHGQSTCCNLQPAGGLDAAAHLQDGTMKASAAVSDGSTAFLTSCRALALTVAAAELVGQVEAHCSQRGLALARLWNCQVQNNAGPLVLSFPSSPGSVPAAAPKARISFGWSDDIRPQIQHAGRATRVYRIQKCTAGTLSKIEAVDADCCGKLSALCRHGSRGGSGPVGAAGGSGSAGGPGAAWSR